MTSGTPVNGVADELARTEHRARWLATTLHSREWHDLGLRPEDLRSEARMLEHDLRRLNNRYQLPHIERACAFATALRVRLDSPFTRFVGTRSGSVLAREAFWAIAAPWEHRPSPAARSMQPAGHLTDLASRVLPPAHRARYREEYRSELYELASAGASRLRQMLFALRLLDRSWVLRAELRAASPRRVRS